jgi:hypothetical protein
MNHVKDTQRQQHYQCFTYITCSPVKRCWGFNPLNPLRSNILFYVVSPGWIIFAEKITEQLIKQIPKYVWFESSLEPQQNIKRHIIHIGHVINIVIKHYKIYYCYLPEFKIVVMSSINASCTIWVSVKRKVVPSFLAPALKYNLRRSSRNELWL